MATPSFGCVGACPPFLWDQDTWDWNPSLDLFRVFAGALEVLENERIGAPVGG